MPRSRDAGRLALRRDRRHGVDQCGGRREAVAAVPPRCARPSSSARPAGGEPGECRTRHPRRLVGVEGTDKGVDAALRPPPWSAIPPSRGSALSAGGSPAARRRGSAAARAFDRDRRARPAGATPSTRPQASASAASIVSPVSSSRRARPAPISFGSSAASTTEGMPIATSGMPNTERLAGDPQIAGGGELEPGAERVAVDPGDDRHRQAAERVAAAMHQGDEGARAGMVEGGDLADIGAADKGALAGAGQDHQPQRRVGGEPGHRCRRSRPSARG